MPVPACYHCGLPVAEPGCWRAPVLGVERAFCCAGCEAVARTIVAAGFEKYYETRTAVGARAEDLPPVEVYDDPAAQRQFAARSGEHRRSATLILDRIRCTACLWLNEQWLRRLPGLVRVDVNYATRRAQVEWDERETRLSRILEAVRAIGYDAYPFDPQRQAGLERAERRAALWRLFVAGFGAMQVMMYAFPAYLDEGGTLSPAGAQVLRWASLVLTTPVVLFSCGPFFGAAWRDLKARRIGLDTPIALGIAVGLAMNLAELAEDWPQVALVPIVSEARAAGLIARRWLRRGRAPDAIVVEHPRYAGGHLGAARLEEVDDPRFDFARVLPEIRATLHDLGLDAEAIPLVAAGGINSPARVAEALAAGASAVQLGTPFAVAEEGDAHPNFKRVLAEARREDIVVFMSVAGLPARAVRTPWLAHYLEKEAVLQRRAKKRAQCTLAWDCLAHCGLREGLPRAGQFCIDHHLAAALRGDTERGLFFRGSEPLPFGAEIRPVRELVAHLLD